MIEESFMPLNRHFDSGFGATADAFHEAAKAIDTQEHKHGFGLNQSRLPVLYLYRHANELYLKSILTIIHRRFSSQYPSVDQNDFPSVLIDNRATPIFRVHSLLGLFNQYRILLERNAKSIKQVSRTDWVTEPEDLENWVTKIDDADRSSTMFRYPMTLDPSNDARKSAFKDIDPKEVVSEMKRRSETGIKGAIILAMQNERDEIIESYIRDDESMSEIYNALASLAQILSCAQFGMRYEFVNSK